MSAPRANDTHHLSGLAREVAEAVVKEARRILGREPETGGCRTFYTPEEWADRGEEHGLDSVLVIVHDGGDLAHLLDWSRAGAYYFDRFAQLPGGTYVQQATGWYSYATK